MTGLALGTLDGVVVNGRFLDQPVTGVQRYGREIVARLTARHPELQVVRPGPTAGGGWRGHLWEQRELPRAAGELLVGFANWGPLAATRQVVTFHDAGPWLAGAHYDRRFRALARRVWPRLAARAIVMTVSERARRNLAAVLGLGEPAIPVIPPGVGPPFTDATPQAAARRYALFVGGHDGRKNLEFLVDLWPDVARSLDLDLVVISRSRSRAHRGSPDPGRGCRLVVDPTDEELAGWYAGAVCVLMPSRYEGYGLPLLEAMAAGTPFVATDVGAAAELALEPSVQIQPLDPAAWRAAIGVLAGGRHGLGAAGKELAATRTWDAAADTWVAHLGNLLR